MAVDLVAARWRVGRRVGRTVYAMVGSDPSDRDVLVGMMDTPALAAAAVAGHNLHAPPREPEGEWRGIPVYGDE